MDKEQAESAADALLEPERAERRKKELNRQAIRSQQELQRRRGKVAVWFLLAGSAIGALVAYSARQPIHRGLAFGALSGSTVGWLVASRIVRAPAA